MRAFGEKAGLWTNGVARSCGWARVDRVGVLILGWLEKTGGAVVLRLTAGPCQVSGQGCFGFARVCRFMGLCVLAYGMCLVATLVT